MGCVAAGDAPCGAVLGRSSPVVRKGRHDRRAVPEDRRGRPSHGDGVRLRLGRERRLRDLLESGRSGPAPEERRERQPYGVAFGHLIHAGRLRIPCRVPAGDLRGKRAKPLHGLATRPDRLPAGRRGAELRRRGRGLRRDVRPLADRQVLGRFDCQLRSVDLGDILLVRLYLRLRHALRHGLPFAADRDVDPEHRVATCSSSKTPSRCRRSSGSACR